MGYLVGNGFNLYRRSGSLVRSPILKSVPLVPDEMAYYPLCGEYNGSGSDRAPARGFCSLVGLITTGDAMQVGKQMRKAYLNISPSTYQGWYRATDKTPNFVFYHGLYGATAPNTFCAEAFMMVPAYHFTIPSQYNGFGVHSASLSLTHYGCISAYQRAGTDHAANNVDYRDYYISGVPTSIIPADSDWRNKWVQRIGLYGDLTSMNIRDVHNAATDDITLNTTENPDDFLHKKNGDTWSQTDRYSPLIGNISVSYADDGIPISWHPWTQTVSLSTTICHGLGTSRSGWIVISPNVSVGTNNNQDTANDYPYYYPSSWGRWLCCSFGSYALTVNLELG